MQRSQPGPRLGAAALVSIGADGARCRENQVFWRGRGPAWRPQQPAWNRLT